MTLALREAARLLGGKVLGGRISCPGPNHSQRDRSLTVWFNNAAPEGFGVYSFAGDDIGACRDHVRNQLGLPERPRRVPALHRPPVTMVVSDTHDDARARLRVAMSIWTGAVPIKGTLAETYLQQRRGLRVTSDLAHVLRYHGGLRYEGRTTPALVALFRDLRTDEPCGIHRVFLNAIGGKLDRKMFGRVKNAAIKLDPDENVSLGLHLAEGIETGLAAQQVGYCPVWALGSVGAIAEFPMLAGIEAIVIMGENDDASARASIACEKRYRAVDRDAHICLPPMGDLNDALMPGAAA